MEGNPNRTRCTVTAKDLGHYSRQQRQRWEICASVPDITVGHIKHKILASSEGVLTLAALISAGKQHLREQEADEHTALEDGCTVADLQTLIDASKRYGVIYADPPWTFKV